MNEWISVKDRLPPIGEYVIILYQWMNPPDKFSVCTDCLHIVDSNMRPHWLKHKYTERVRYWMPCPPVPKEL